MTQTEITFAEHKKETVYNQVKNLLKEYALTRDSYTNLMRCMYPSGLQLNYILEEIDNGKLPSFASVERARRQVQSDHPSLRGINYIDRKSKAKEVTETICADPINTIEGIR